MLRRLVLSLAFAILASSGLSSVRSPKLVSLLDDSYATILTATKWIFAACLLLEVNALLNRWAENRWAWKTDEAKWMWKDEIAVVTGGSRGIGAEVAKKLASFGIKVAVLDVVPLSEDLPNDGPKLINFYNCDITSRHQVRQAGEAIRSTHGTPSILINNAGIGNANNILEVTPERLRTIFDVNLLSHWNTVQEFLPGMMTLKKGHIMSTSSLGAFVGLAGMVDYSCTKAALIAFHEGLTQELKHRYNCPQIKTTIVYPNWTRTRLISAIETGIKTVRAPIVKPENVAEAMVRQIIAARSGQLILGPSITASIRALPMWLQELIRDHMAHIVVANATTAVA